MQLTEDNWTPEDHYKVQRSYNKISVISSLNELYKASNLCALWFSAHIDIFTLIIFYFRYDSECTSNELTSIYADSTNLFTWKYT